MSAITAQRGIVRLPVRLLRFLRDLIVGTMLCLSPLTAILALGWVTRRMDASVRLRWGEQVARPGWVLEARGRGWFVRLFGGLAANIRIGLQSALGLAALTLPFTVLWLGAWWAGWENSFNKGYEQAAVGPLVWMIGTLLSLPILAHLPIAAAHAAFEDRFGAFFEWRRIRSVAAAAGWRLPWLGVMTVLLSVPFFGLRAIPVFVEDVVPGFAEMTIDQKMQIAGTFDLLGAALAFTVVLIIRGRAAAIYARCAPIAAQGRRADLWSGHAVAQILPKSRETSRAMSWVWVAFAYAVWAVLPVMIVMGQFMNYTPINWLTHPAFLLPWVG